MKVAQRLILAYVGEDRREVERLYSRLSSAGFRPWMARKDISPGKEWEHSIGMAIRGADFFLACLSPN